VKIQSVVVERKSPSSSTACIVKIKNKTPFGKLLSTFSAHLQANANEAKKRQG
jgi:hypothetical protein